MDAHSEPFWPLLNFAKIPITSLEVQVRKHNSKDLMIFQKISVQEENQQNCTQLVDDDTIRTERISGAWRATTQKSWESWGLSREADRAEGCRPSRGMTCGILLWNMSNIFRKETHSCTIKTDPFTYTANQTMPDFFPSSITQMCILEVVICSSMLSI